MLLFSHNHTVTVVAAVFMIGYHLFIISTFPLAVPLEWNVVFMYITAFLFLGYPAQDGYALGNMGTGLLIRPSAGLLFFPVLGNLRPDLVSFLPSMRQYAGNWASAMWAFAPGCEAEAQRAHRQAGADAEGPAPASAAARSRAGGRGGDEQMLGVALDAQPGPRAELGDDQPARRRHRHYTLREAEFCCNAIVGFNFGDGHLHNQRLIQAIQKRCQFAPGEFIVVWVESEPVFSGRQQYWVMDAAVGIVERGSWAVKDAVEEQPWLPNGPIATGRLALEPGYERVSYGADARGDAGHARVLGGGMSTAVVVGSGPNGLAAALTLAAAGVEVTVLEAADDARRRHAQQRADAPGPDPRRVLGGPPAGGRHAVRRARSISSAHGLTWRWPEIQYAHPLDGGAGRGGAGGRSSRPRPRSAAATGGAGSGCSARCASGSTTSPPTSCARCCTCPRTRSKLARFGAVSGLPAGAARAAVSARPRAGRCSPASPRTRSGRSRAPMSSAIGVTLGTAAHRYGWPVAEGGSAAISRRDDLAARGARREVRDRRARHVARRARAGRDRDARRRAGGRGPDRRRADAARGSRGR